MMVAKGRCRGKDLGGRGAISFVYDDDLCVCVRRLCKGHG